MPISLATVDLDAGGSTVTGGVMEAGMLLTMNAVCLSGEPVDGSPDSATIQRLPILYPQVADERPCCSTTLTSCANHIAAPFPFSTTISKLSRTTNFFVIGVAELG